MYEHFVVHPSYLEYMSSGTNTNALQPQTVANTTPGTNTERPSSSPPEGKRRNHSVESIHSSAESIDRPRSPSITSSMGQPTSATAWLSLLAAQTGDGSLASVIGTPNQPIITTI